MTLPIPGRKYTYEQVAAMARRYPGYKMVGYVLRKDADGMYSFVPEHKAAGAFGRGKALGVGYESKETIRELFPIDPKRRRTPQERLDSLTDRLIGEWRKSGTIPGLSEQQVQDMVGRAWRRGQPVTAEHVRAIAASALADAENKYEASERRKVVRTSPTD